MLKVIKILVGDVLKMEGQEHKILDLLKEEEVELDTHLTTIK
jgi:hypothetical protein